MAKWHRGECYIACHHAQRSE